MKNIIFTILLLLLPMPDLLYPQDVGEMLFNTTYDYLYNNSPSTFIEMVDLDNDGNPDPVILLADKLYYKINNVWNSLEPFPQFYRTISMQYCSKGPFSGKILALANNSVNGSMFALIDPGNWQISNINLSDLFRSFVYLNDGNILVQKSNSTTFDIYKSTDQGATFNYLVTVGDGDPSVDLLNSQNGPSESPIKISQNGQCLTIVGAYENAAVSGIPDIIYKYSSSNAGNTWSGKIIGRGSGSHPLYGQVFERDYAPYFTNFGQLSYAVDNEGKTHVVANGYGKGVINGANDTTDVFPVLYYNENYDTWFDVTDQAREYPTDGFGNSVLQLYPRFGIGNAYPSLAIRPDGKSILFFWQSFEYTGGYNTPFNIYPGDNGSNSTSVYYTDLVLRRAYDHTAAFGGIEWSSEGEVVESMINNSRTEQFPVLAPHLGGDGVFIIYASYIYQYDAVPRLSVGGFPQNDPSDETAWFYKTYIYIGTSVEEDLTSVKDFNLYQNYPNPFNPSTKISWQSPVGSHQTLKVYDVLGNEVATLVDEYRNAGSYEIKFNPASSIKNPASGVYFYQLKAGEYLGTKKMLLIK